MVSKAFVGHLRYSKDIELESTLKKQRQTRSSEGLAFAFTTPGPSLYHIPSEEEQYATYAIPHPHTRSFRNGLLE